MRPQDRQHPTDESLLALYFEEESVRSENDAERGVRQHLHGCEACTWRYTALTAPLQQLRKDAASEADEVFTPGRLAAQRAAILHRLDDGKGTPRVVAFPGAQPARPRISHRPVARWMAAAAAAGLLVGVTAGRLVHMSDATGQVQVPRAARSVEQPRLVSQPQVSVTPASADAEAAELSLFYGLESAVSRRPQVAELSALDEMTPHPRETLLALAR